MIELKHVIPFLTLFLGVLIGHRLAIGRDKRKEFNLATQNIRTNAIRQLDAMQGAQLGNPISKESILELRGTIGPKRSAKIFSAFKEYERAYKIARVDIPATTDNPFHEKKIIAEEIPKYKNKLMKLISTVEPQ
jgi:hypothetical protein